MRQHHPRNLHLLGYWFSPRLADNGGTRFCHLGGKADYCAQDELTSQPINTALIVEHWEDLLRLAGSPKPGTVQAADLIRPLRTKNRLSKLGRALKELSRLIKTLDPLRSIDDEAYRGRTLVQLNRGEGRHQLAHIVFHSKPDEPRSGIARARKISSGFAPGGQCHRALENEETIYIYAALSQLDAKGFDVTDESVAELSSAMTAGSQFWFLS